LIIGISCLPDNTAKPVTSATGVAMAECDSSYA
jgi:hypothetical protein